MSSTKRGAFVFKGKKYWIDHSKKRMSIGDFYEKKGLVLVDKRMPKKFLDGIALHEIVERIFIKKGYSYEYSHNKAQKSELKFYQKIFGKSKGKQMLIEEEKNVLNIFEEDIKKDLKNLRPIKKVAD